MGQEILVLRGHERDVSSVAFNPDGNRILTGSRDSTARIWDAETGHLILSTPMPQRPSGLLSAVLSTLRQRPAGVFSVAFSPDGSRIATGDEYGLAKVWDAAAAAATDRVADPATAQLVLTLAGHASNLTRRGSRRKMSQIAEEFSGCSVAFSPNGRQLVTGGFDRTVKVWNAENRQLMQTLKGHTGPIAGLAYSPLGDRIVTVSQDQTARIWDAATWKELLVLRKHTKSVTCVAFSADGKSILTGGDDRLAMLWDVESGRHMLTLKGHTSGVTCVAFSPDGQRFLTGSADRTAKIWESKSGHEVLTIHGHSKSVASAAFSPNGNQIVTAGKDGTVMVREANRVD
jgi:WD40 repeat protein